MKKIGILTFHRTPNYGASLQAFALKTFMQKNDCDVHIVDYCCEGNNGNYIENMLASKTLIKGIVKSAIYGVITIPDYKKKIEKFELFRERYYATLALKDSIELDMVICGSDQIWNPRITGGLKSMYFGARELRPKYAISYGASLGSIDELQDVRVFFELLKYLNKIGVREKSLNVFLNSHNINNTKTIDPTFLLSKDEYINQFNLSRNNKKYILIYELMENEQLQKIAQKIHEIHDFDIITICGYYNTKIRKHKKIFDAGPIEFLNYIYNAEYVITNSFHGVAFSIIFEKNFFVVPPKKRASRIIDLLSELNLENRLILEDKVNEGPVDTEIKYHQVNHLLNPLISNSKDYLIEALLEVPSGENND